MKLNHKIPTERLDPKPTVPKEILEQHPWHWDPMKKDHSDETCYLKNIKFDWAALAKWSIEKCNEHLTPQKYWWYDYENDVVMHAKDNVNNMPIREQAKLALKNNTHNKDNSQYFKIANEEFGHWYEPLAAMFPNLKKDKMGISLFIQMPGHTIWSHVDTYSSFIRRTKGPADYSVLRRYMVFVKDWDWGHFFHYGNHCFNQWQAGDCWDLRPGIYHGSANAGVNPKITIHWSGEIND
jgi:hypothetical protein